ncbi:hypothetical protein F5884DRAFT_852094 [Xylogone sp. PMI_703]|nr:hypothetical protein F5884DRAFT_852094 [Xylogone sp. PMI_703]
MLNPIRYIFPIASVLLICVNLVFANSHTNQNYRRDDSSDTPTTPTHISELISSNTPSSAKGSGSEPTGNDSSGHGHSTTSRNLAISTSVHTLTTSPSSIVSPKHSPSNINASISTSLNANSTYNATLTPDKLPLAPHITPGFGVAGIILMLTGAVYTVIGIKIKFLHIYLSTAFLASLGVTVLVVYVMNPPVSNAIQGAYVVAAILTGIVVGGLSLIFAEITEGLGCLLGGFCLSMWLLVLRPGGLLTSNAAKGALIGAVSFAVFATSFSHYTRPYGLIGSISFGGGTVIVLGIDCFSRAGLKEFWAYIWKLNDNLFPLGATTYPITRGLRVEIYAIIFIFLVGVISQLKLWKVVKEQRERREIERLQRQQSLQQEAEEAGRRIEQHAEQERSEWEATYSEKKLKEPVEEVRSVRGSSFGEMEIPNVWTSSSITARQSAQDMIEMAPSEGDIRCQNREGTITLRDTKQKRNGSLMSRLNISQFHTTQDGLGVEDAHTESLGWQDPSRYASDRFDSNLPPILPLPFEMSKETEKEKERDDVSVMATVADEEEQSAMRRISKRFSVGAGFLKRLSERSLKRFSKEGGSSDYLVPAPQVVEDDRASSIAATIDELSSDSDHDDMVMDEARSSIVTGLEEDQNVISRITVREIHSGSSSPSVTDTPEIEIRDKGKRVSTNSNFEPRGLSYPPRPAPIQAATTEGYLTRDRLPQQVSKVVKTYRTDEWAKHIYDAETPDVTSHGLTESQMYVGSGVAETPAPVNVHDLQEAPANTSHPKPVASVPQPTRMSHLRGTSQSKSQISAYDGYVPEEGILHLSPSQQSLTQNSPPLGSTGKLGHLRRVSGNILANKPVVESSVEENSYPSSGSGASRLPPHLGTFGGSVPTLLGVRDAVLRNPRGCRPSLSARSSTLELNSFNSSPRNSSVPSSDGMSPQIWASSFDSHQPKRGPNYTSMQIREQQLANWRADVQQGLRGSAQVHGHVERQRSALWMEQQQQQQQQQQRKAAENKRKQEKEGIILHEQMRRKDMLELHREVMKKIQNSANKV